MAFIILRQVKNLALFFFVMLTTTSSAYASEIIAALNNKNDEWRTVHKDGSVTGIWAEYFTALSKESGHPIKLKVMPIRRIIRDTDVGAIDLSIIPRNLNNNVTENEAYRLHSSPLRFVIIGLKDTPAITNLDQLINKKIMGHPTTGEIGVLGKIPGITVLRYEGFKNSCKVLKFNRVDYAMVLENPFTGLCEQEYNISLGTPYLFRELSFELYVSNKFKSSNKLSPILRAVKILRDKKTIEILACRYFIGTNQQNCAKTITAALQ